MSNIKENALALSILCQGAVQVPKKVVFSRDWWKKTFTCNDLLEQLRAELEQDLPAEMCSLVRWFEGTDDVPPDQVMVWVRASNIWLTDVLSQK